MPGSQRLTFFLAGTSLLFFAGSSLAQQSRHNARPPSCDKYDQLQIPPADLPTPQGREALAKCDAYNLYFGFDGPADPVAARKCAYLQRDEKNRAMGNPFEGSGLLAMIYANGKGATRNFELAQEFSCEIDGTPAENADRFEHIAKLQRKTGRELISIFATTPPAASCKAGVPNSIRIGHKSAKART